MTLALFRNARLLSLAIAFLMVAGFAAISTLPRTEDPRVLNRLAVVLTPYPGASAERVEALVTDPIEQELRELPEIQTLSSTSTAGLSVITIELKDTITETASVWSRARDQVADAQSQLPAGALASRFDDDRGYAFTVMYALTWEGGIASASEESVDMLSRHAEELQSRLRAVGGTDLVEIYGEPEEEILVTLDTGSSTLLGLSAAQVAAALSGADSKVSAGEVHNEVQQSLVEVRGELDSLSRIGSVPLRTLAQGETVTVADVATIQRQPRTPPSERVISNGQPAVVVAVRMLPDLRIDHWKQSIDVAVEQFSNRLPVSTKLTPIFDQSGYTEERLMSLVGDITLGFVLIVAVLLLTLGWRAALIVASALPLTALFTLMCMSFIGLPIHQMSVTGLVVALGIMVDNAIVIADGVQQRLQRGLTRAEAVARAIRHFWLPLLGSTLTTILAFSPIALMPGPAGEFVGGIALSVIFSLIGSYLISQTIVSALAGRLLKRGADTQSWLDRGIRTPRLRRAFEASLHAAIRNPVKTLLLVPVLPIAGFVAAQFLTEQFFPPSDRNMFNVELYLPEQSSLITTEQAAREVAAVIAESEDISAQTWYLGNSAPPFYYNLMQLRDGRRSYAQGMITAKDFHSANRLIPELQTALDDNFPGMQILVRKLEQGPPFVAPVEVRVYGNNTDQLRLAGEELRRRLSTLENVTHTRSTLGGTQPKAWIDVDEQAARIAGLTLGDIASQLNANLSGVVGGSVLEESEELPVRIRVGEAQRSNPGQVLESLLSPGPGLDGSGTQSHGGLPVAAIGSLNVLPAESLITRRNGLRVNTVEAYLRADVLPATVLTSLHENLAASPFSLPAGYHLEIGGESAERNQAVGNLMANVGMIVALLFIVIVLTFNSFRLSGVILAVAAQSAGLGLLAVFLGGYPFGFTVIVGLMGLMGLAINAAIVILAELRQSEAARRGDVDATVEGVMGATRHITSTTITTVGGFMPLLLTGGGFWPPFALSIAGGTVMATILSFYFAPAAFRVMTMRRSFEYSAGPGQESSTKLRRIEGRSTAKAA